MKEIGSDFNGVSCVRATRQGPPPGAPRQLSLRPTEAGVGPVCARATAHVGSRLFPPRSPLLGHLFYRCRGCRAAMFGETGRTVHRIAFEHCGCREEGNFESPLRSAVTSPEPRRLRASLRQHECCPSATRRWSACGHCRSPGDRCGASPCIALGGGWARLSPLHHYCY